MSSTNDSAADFKTLYPSMLGYAPYNHVNMGKPLGRGDVICGKIKEARALLREEELDCQNGKNLANGNTMLPLSVVITPEIIAAHHRKPPTQEEIDRIEKFLAGFN
jgi:hypothetical protein